MILNFFALRRPPAVKAFHPDRKFMRLALPLIGMALCASFAVVQLAGAQQRTSPTETETWTTMASMPVAQCEGGTAVLNGRIYVMGGWKDEPSPYNLVQIYDVAKNEWSEGVPLPEAVHHEGVAVVGGKIYVIGGFQQAFPHRVPIDHVWEFDPVTGKWTARAPLPAPRGALVVEAIGNLIYAAGGEHDRPPGASLDPPGSPAAYLPVADLAVYNPQTDTWKTLPPMHVRRDHAYGAVMNGKLYVVGGRDRPVYTLDALSRNMIRRRMHGRKRRRCRPAVPAAMEPCSTASSTCSAAKATKRVRSAFSTRPRPMIRRRTAGRDTSPWPIPGIPFRPLPSDPASIFPAACRMRGAETPCRWSRPSSLAK